MPLTGERTVPGVWHERYWFQRHVAAYRVAAARCRGLAVVDAGCGEGYGAALLAATAASVVGVDLVPEVVDHARRTYPQVRFVEAELSHIPDLADGAAQAVVSFQVIEHLWDVPAFLAEMGRLLAPGGELLIATPNRLTFTPGSDTPVNPFHTREFTAAELTEVLATAGFRLRGMLGLHHGPRLRAVEAALHRPLPERARWPLPRTSGRRGCARSCAPCGPWDFTWRPDDLDASLDLLAIASRRESRVRAPRPPAVGAPPRHLPLRRGVAVPDRVGVGAAAAGRRWSGWRRTASATSSRWG